MIIGFIAVFLSLVISGIFYLLSSASPGLRSKASDWAGGAISGLIILTTIYLIITTINPQLRIFKIGELPEIPPPPPTPPLPGIYLFEKANCPAPPPGSFPEAPFSSSISDFGPLRNKINSVKIVHSPETNLYFIAILYDVINFQGKCQYINPNTGCVSVKPFAASASIYRYSFSPQGNGVTFYRKSFYNQEGGWYTVGNLEIQGNYIATLKDLKFKDVPKEEQDCVERDLKGECTKREPPTLGGENITSIKIDGDYMVMLIYFKKGTDTDTKWSFCQAFPTTDDKNKEGPKQIKWEHIRQLSGGILPNYVIIFPVKEK